MAVIDYSTVSWRYADGERAWFTEQCKKSNRWNYLSQIMPEWYRLYHTTSYKRIKAQCQNDTHSEFCRVAKSNYPKLTDSFYAKASKFVRARRMGLI